MADLATIISMVESSGNPRAMRFEPTAFANWPWSDTMGIIKAKHGCSEATARMIACTSWGQYQLMAENIFARNMTAYQVNPTDVFSFVSDTALQEQAFHAFLQIRGIDFTLDDILSDPQKMRKFVERYNGPGDIDAYTKRIMHFATIG